MKLFKNKLNIFIIEKKLVTNHTIVSLSLEAARKKAVDLRDGSCHFDDWAHEYYNITDTSFCSGDGENYDCDNQIRIWVETLDVQSIDDL